MDFAKKLSVAYAWNMLGKLVIRGLGVISTLVLVRLLNPDDFGLVAIATMVIGFFEVLSNVGVNRYLIMHPNPTDDDYNAAWTFNLFSRLFLLLFLIALSPYVASYLDEPDVRNVIVIFCAIKAVEAFKNIGMVKFQKAIDFSVVNRLLIYSKIISAITTIVAAFYFENYFALIIGATVSTFSHVFLSFTFSEFRPRLNLNIPKGMLLFSSLLIFRNIFGYTRSQIDTLLVGKIDGANSVGKYHLAREFAILPLTELVGPVMEPFFSALSSCKQDIKKVITKTYQILFLSWVLIFIFIALINFVSVEFTNIVLGQKWSEVSEYLGLFSILMLPFNAQAILVNLYDLLNKTKVSMLGDIYGLLTIVIVFYLSNPVNVASFADIRIYVGLSSFAVVIILARIFLPLSINKIILLISVPLISASTSYLAVSFLNEYMALQGVYKLLICPIVLALTYCSCLFISIYLLPDKYKYFIIELVPQVIFEKLPNIRREDF